VNTRTILIVLGVAAVAGGVLYWRRNRAIAAAAQAERARAALLANPQLVANALRAETQRRNSAGSLWAALNQKA
jgi:CHASE3 domain sensor protein